VDQLTAAIRELAFQLKRDQENSAKDQEIRAKDQKILRLQLETALLRFERRLPPASGAEASSELS
jgi:hypothetical protein